MPTIEDLILAGCCADCDCDPADCWLANSCAYNLDVGDDEPPESSLSD